LPLMYQPGERWQYNTGSLVLSVLVARASQQPLPDLVRTRIFGPLGMKDTGFTMPAEETDRLPSNYMTNFQTGKLEQQTNSGPEVWTTAPAFPSGAAGLVSTIDDYLAFAQLLHGRGVLRGKPLLSPESVRLMTTNHLTPEQMAGGGPILGGQGWGFLMSVATAPDDVSSEPGRYGWNGGYGTFWFNDPTGDLIAIAMTQVSDILFNGTTTEFAKLAMNS
jgi:CubicO group peptidase (beta-lactamase class C family)